MSLFVGLPNDIYNSRESLPKQEEYENRKIKTINIESNVISNNGRGLSSSHYNRDIGDRGEYYHRYSNETISLRHNAISRSRGESMLIQSPFYDPCETQLAEINYTLIDNQLFDNSRGVVQFSRDIRNSNNLFHWHLAGTLFENNQNSGIVLRLPYVWQYNENFTHSIVMDNNTIFRNHDFQLLIDGHYSRVNLTNNLFKENHCRDGLLRVTGMEKALIIEDNIFSDNFGHFVVELAMQSHADRFGLVQAEFRRNFLLKNRDTLASRSNDMYHPQSYALALRGVQFVNVTRNLLNNPNLQFELLAGVLTGSLDNRLNVEENWWGSFDPNLISGRIFDFDDWNSYAIADYSPFLGQESLDAVTVPVDIDSNHDHIDLNQPIGGRIKRNLILNSRDSPYLIKSDITVMPGVQLVIEEGVTLEFYPSVGMLVLGDLTAAGTDSRPVVMRPAKLADENSLRFKRQSTTKAVNYDLDSRDHSATDLTNVRLCISETCEEWSSANKTGSGLNTPNDGFVEVFNRTTQQWMAICDDRFTERNAQVVCRQLGFSSLNVHLRRGRRLDVGPTRPSRVRYWPEPLECVGTESSLGSCDVRLNGYGNHTHACTWDGDTFVYVSCGRELLSGSATDGRPVTSTNHYWGGVRFVRSIYETRSDHYRTPTRSFSFERPNSRLQHVRLVGAGILHGEKNSALQLVQRDVNVEFLNVSKCASHAVEVIAPSGHLVFHRLNLRDNLGAGINYLLLGGASTETSVLPYRPLIKSTLPYNVYGLVDVCDTNKKLIVQERVLVYYKYDNRPVDCVKIFAADNSAKRLGFRVLQFNLFNSTSYAAVTDHVRLIDGDIFNQTSRIIGDLGVTEKHRQQRPETLFYSTKESKLSVKVRIC